MGRSGKLERRVVDHGAFEVEAAVAEVEDEVDVLLFR